MISVVVPVYNEEGSIAPLLAEIAAAAGAGTAPITEVIYVDDGSTDGTAQALDEARRLYPGLRVLRHARRCGQSAGFWHGGAAARGEVLVLMDGDGQNDPADIRLLWEHYQATGAAVMGQRAVRRDNFVRRWSSKVANALRRAMLRDGVRDTGCSLKLIPTAAYRALPYFDHMHRFLPALLLRAHVPVEAVDVSHRPRERGASKYGFWGRLWVGVFDVLGVWWLSRRALPPVAVQEC